LTARRNAAIYADAATLRRSFVRQLKARKSFCAGRAARNEAARW
jgi:hypothetical protein